MPHDLELDKIVPRGTISKFHQFSELLTRWNKRINIVSPQDIPQLMHRHILDSAQLAPLLKAPAQSRAIDLGTGGGFPGLILAMLTDHEWHLVESDRRKCAFLQTAIAELEIDNAAVHCARIEDLPLKGTIITARALAELGLLLNYAVRIMDKNAICVFLKGKNWANEIEEASARWQFDWEDFPTQTVADGRILKIRDLSLKG